MPMMPEGAPLNCENADSLVVESSQLNELSKPEQFGVWVFTRLKVSVNLRGNVLKHPLQCHQAVQKWVSGNLAQFYWFLQALIKENGLLRLAQPIQESDAVNLPLSEQSTPAVAPRGVILRFLHQSLTSLHLNVEQVWFTVRRITLLLQETEAMVEEISRLADAEAELGPAIDFSMLPDIRCPGEHGVEQRTFMVTDEHRKFPPGTQRQRQFRTLLYTPRRWRTGKTPVVIVSHGLGSKPEAFGDYAEYLTSHGYVVAIPQHPGSDADRMLNMLAGHADEMFNLEEFSDRPLDVTRVLDELERRNQSEYRGRLNLTSVGVMGHSFGGYTALALAGAEIDFEALELACTLIPGIPNLSLLLQCRALGLPRQSYSFCDRRVKAILPLDPVGSEVFGSKGLRPIQIPVLIMAGSNDSTTPAIFEQIRVFPWLTTLYRYLALVKGKAHVGSFSNLDAGLKLVLRAVTNWRGPDSTVFYNYINSLSLAFFETYLAGDSSYSPYLQSSYAKYISQAPFNLHLISAASCRTTSCDEIDQRLKAFISQISQLC
jgi:predicted dienelactone hydrolase